MRFTCGLMMALLFPVTGMMLVQGQSLGQKRSPARPKPVDNRCPKLVVEALPATGAAIPNTHFKFRVLLEGMKERSDLSFDWTAVSGAIVAGQAEPIVTVEAQAPNPVDLVVTVRVGGLSPDCPASVSFSPPPPITCGLPFDTYGALDPEDEKARLDSFAIALQNDSKVLGYIIVYGGRRGRRGEAQASADRARVYLVNERGVAAEQVVTIDGGFREEFTFELFLVPPKAAPPGAVPTLDKRDVEFTDHPF